MIPPEKVPSHLADLAPYFTVACEAQVIDISRRTHYGPWAKLRLPEHEMLHGFEPGQRYQILMIRLGDDEMAASNEDRPYKLSQRAGMFCNQPEFWQWIWEAYDVQCKDKDEAAAWLRSVCNVDSRSLFDTDTVAGETFRKLMAEFDSWKKTR